MGEIQYKFSFHKSDQWDVWLAGGMLWQVADHRVILCLHDKTQWDKGPPPTPVDFLHICSNFDTLSIHSRPFEHYGHTCATAHMLRFPVSGSLLQVFHFKSLFRMWDNPVLEKSQRDFAFSRKEECPPSLCFVPHRTMIRVALSVWVFICSLTVCL